MKTTWIATIGLLVVVPCGCRTVRPPVEVNSRLATGILASKSSPDSPSSPSGESVVHVGFHQQDADRETPIARESASFDFADGFHGSYPRGHDAPRGAVSDEMMETPVLRAEIAPTSLVQMEQIALATNPAVAEIQAEIGALRGKLTQAGLPPNPTAGINGEDINEDGGAGRYGVFLGREVVRGNKLGLSQSVVCAEIRAAEQRLAVVEQRLLTDVRQRYYDLLVAQETLSVTDELVRISTNAVDVSRKLVEAKEAAQTSVLQSELELQTAIVAKQQAENLRLGSRRKLAALLGEVDLPVESVAGDVREMLVLDDFEPFYDQLVNNSPEIAALFAEVEQRHRQLARECVEPVPNVTWQTTLQYDTVGDDVIAGFQIGMPIPTLNRNQGAIDQARHQIIEAERRAEKKALDLRHRLATAYESYLDAKLQVDAYDSGIIPNAKETLDLVTEGYEQGEIDFLQLLTAQRTYSQITLTYLRQLREAWRQNAEIRGMLLTGSLE